MATEVLLYLTYLAVILLIGLLTSIVSQKLRIPNVLLLLIIGIGLGRVEYKNAPLIHFPEMGLSKKHLQKPCKFHDFHNFYF